MLHTYRLFVSYSYCAILHRLFEPHHKANRGVVLHIGFMQPTNQQTIYYLPSARIESLIYKCGIYPHASIIYSILPSLLCHLSTDTLAAAAAVPVVTNNTAKIACKLLPTKEKKLTNLNEMLRNLKHSEPPP